MLKARLKVQNVFTEASQFSTRRSFAARALGSELGSKRDIVSHAQ